MKARQIAARTARYVMTGVLCAVANNAVMILGDAAGGHYVPMTVLSFALVTPLAYLLHAGFTFKEPLSWRAFLRFAAGVATGLPLSFLTMAVFCTGFGVPVIIAAPLATLTLVLWNYASAHWAIVGRQRFH
jgi:putative flippase GtrA